MIGYLPTSSSLYPSLALFIFCVSDSCLYGFRRFEYSASCVSLGSECEDVHHRAELILG